MDQRFFQPLRIFAFKLAELAYFRIIQPGVQFILPLKLALSGGHYTLFNGGAVFSRHYRFTQNAGGGNGISSEIEAVEKGPRAG